MIHATQSDVGRFVVYRTEGQLAEAGRITGVRPEFVHVRFPEIGDSKGCRREDLTWLDDLVEKPQPHGQSVEEGIEDLRRYLAQNGVGYRIIDANPQEILRRVRTIVADALEEAKPAILSEPELAAIASRHAATTPGEWDCDENYVYRNGRAVLMGTVGVSEDLRAEKAQRTANVGWAAAAHQDIPKLLAREAELLMALHDRMLESAMLEQGRREVLGAALAAMDAVIDERQERSRNALEYSPTEAHGFQLQADAVTRARNLLTAEMAALCPANPLPPADVRMESLRLREVLREGVAAVTRDRPGVPQTAFARLREATEELNAWARAARQVLREEPS